MPGRNANVATYRHGFNGMEKDDELKGSGNSYDFGARVYDPRIGRWLAVDPFASKYYSWSPYNGMLNNPVRFIDRNGDSVEVIIGLPYTKNGNEHPYGHLALRVFNSTEGYDYVFDFGRYGNIWGLGGSSGDGVLNVYTSSENYKKSEQALRNSVGFIKPTTTEQDKQIIAYFQTLTDEGEKYKTGAVPGGGGIAYKLVDDYYALNNNCVTKSNEGLQLIGINWITGLYKPLDALEIMESLADAANLKRIEYQKGGKKIVTREIKDKQQQSNEIIQKIIDAGTAPQQDNTSPSTYGIPQTTTKEESNSSGG